MERCSGCLAMWLAPAEGRGDLSMGAHPAHHRALAARLHTGRNHLAWGFHGKPISRAKSLPRGAKLSEVGSGAGQRASPDLWEPRGLASPSPGTPGTEPTLPLRFDMASCPGERHTGGIKRTPPAHSPARVCVGCREPTWEALCCLEPAWRFGEVFQAANKVRSLPWALLRARRVSAESRGS